MKYLLSGMLGLLFAFFAFQSCGMEPYEPAADLRESMQERMSDLVRIREAYDRQEEVSRVEFTRFAGLPNSEFVNDVSEYQAYFEIFDDEYEKIFSSESPLLQYNQVVQSCIACHQNVCPGPLRGLHRLLITDADNETADGLIPAGGQDPGNGG